MYNGIFLNRSDNTNLDISQGRTLEWCLEKTKHFKSEFPKFKVKKVNDFFVIDEGVHEFVGTKSRFAEFMIMNNPHIEEFVYCQPAVGLAGPSLCYLTKRYGKKLTLFMPARAVATPHQLVCIENGANVIWERIAAMPNLQAIARKYAEEKGPKTMYIPFGLKHPEVVAGGVKVVHEYLNGLKIPKLWTVVSTGVLTRVLQIALPKTQFVGVAVARNIQAGELGRAEFMSYHKHFNDKSSVIPDSFQSVDTYDAKGWHYMTEFGSPGDWFYNVAKEVSPVNIKPTDVDSSREWKK